MVLPQARVVKTVARRGETAHPLRAGRVILVLCRNGRLCAAATARPRRIILERDLDAGTRETRHLVLVQY